MSPAVKTVDFGATDAFGAHIFRVEIPPSPTGEVTIIEEYGVKGGEEGIPHEEVRAILPRPVWSAIATAARHDFNERLKIKKIPTSRWKEGINKVDRLLGKELCVLAWAAETAEKEKYPVICSKWAALRPEERWWLFFMTAAEAGLAGDRERGWRRALYHALSDGESKARPVKRRRLLRGEEFRLLPLFGDQE